MEAIADAKAIKEMAIANAKASLEESFTPFLKEKFSAKINEMEQEDEIKEKVNEDSTNEVDDMELDEEISLDELLKELEESESTDEDLSEAKSKDEDKKEDKDEDKDKDEDEEEISIEDMSSEDLTGFIESVIKDMIASGELEGGHEGMEDEVPNMDAEETEDEEESEDIEIEDEDMMSEVNIDEEELDEEISLDELLKELEESESTDEDLSEAKKEDKSDELKEALELIKTLNEEINNTNLLNAKLLYTNKIFRNTSLTESQKVKVLEAFDKAKTKDEAKLIYETLSVSIKPNKSQIKESITGIASKVITNTNSTKTIINEDAFARMRELAFGKK